MVSPRKRAGFSLIEALVVLAIGGMALAIIFSIGTKAGDSGFALGRRAMAAAESDIAISDLRTILRSFVLRPTTTFVRGVDQPLEGSSTLLAGDVVMERATTCAPQGWAGRLELSIARRGSEEVLVCRVGDRLTPLITLRRTTPEFSYSTDGQIWRSDFSNAPEAIGATREPGSMRVIIRFRSGQQVDIIETVQSGRLDAWTRRDASF